jgi:hypothetical protein
VAGTVSRRSNIAHSIRARGARAVERYDTLIPLLAGAATAVLGFAQVLGVQALIEATLVVLAALGFAQYKAHSRDVELEGELAGVRDLVADANSYMQVLASGEPYHVLRSETIWDLNTHDAARVPSIKHKRIRFDQNGMLAIRDYSRPDGSVDGYDCTPYKRVREFPNGPRTEFLIALDRIYNRGDEIDFDVRRTLIGSFQGTTEHVGVTITEPCQHVVLVVIWPQTRAPSEVWYEHGLARYARVDVPLQALSSRDGRSEFRLAINEPQQGDQITIYWKWPALVQAVRQAAQQPTIRM